MPLTRRKTLALLGGGVIVAAAAAGTGVAAIAGRVPEKALQPWDAAGGYDDPRMQALSYAILAPNPHNRQPWIVDLNTPDTVILYRDAERDLPATDPYHRQLVIGLGCFLEQMVIAASQTGHAVDLDLFPEGGTGPVAVARFRANAATPDPLFTHVMDRRSCKEPFEDRPVPAALARQLAPFGTMVTEPEEVDAIKKLTWRAWVIEAETPATYAESVELMRFGRAEINANPDGIDLGGGMLEVLIAAGMLTKESQYDTESTSYKEGFRIYEEMLAATPAYIATTTPGNTRADQIAAGRNWLRLNLTTTKLGLALHPVSQALQEYPEMRDIYAAAHQRFAEPGETVQMLGRVGYGPTTPRTPRWPLETRLGQANSV